MWSFSRVRELFLQAHDFAYRHHLLISSTTIFTNKGTLERDEARRIILHCRAPLLKQVPWYGRKVFPVTQIALLFPRNLVRHRSVTHDARFHNRLARNVTVDSAAWHPHTVAVIICPWMSSDDLSSERKTRGSYLTVWMICGEARRGTGPDGGKLYFVPFFWIFWCRKRDREGERERKKEKKKKERKR